MTETRPDEAAPGASASSLEPAQPVDAGGLAGLFGTGDPTVLGRLWIGASLVFLVGIGVVGAVLGVERLKPTSLDVFSSAKNIPQAYSLHSVGATFLVILPLLIGVASIVVPRQLGTGALAFPRAMALAFWAWLLAGGTVVVSYLIDGGPFGTKQDGRDLFIVALGLTAAALLVASLCLATTVLAARAPGLSLGRTPAFAWSILVAATIWIAGLALLIGLLALLYVDSHYQVGLVESLQGNLNGWLRWTVTQPQLYAAGIPVLGFVAEVVPVFTNRRFSRHGVVLGAIGAFGAFSFGGWTFYQVHDSGLTHQALFIGMAFLALLPLLALFGAIGESFVKGKLRYGSPLAFGLAAYLMLFAGVIAGALRSIKGFDLIGTTADASVAHYVMGAAAIAALGAVHYWWPQIVGKPLKGLLANAGALLLLVGTVVLALPDLISGFKDEPATSTAAVEDIVKTMNAISLVGGIILLLGVLVVIADLVGSISRRADDEELPVDPWDAFTLEWAGDPEAVTVTSAAPLLDRKEASA